MQYHRVNQVSLTKLIKSLIQQTFGTPTSDDSKVALNIVLPQRFYRNDYAVMRNHT